MQLSEGRGHRSSTGRTCHLPRQSWDQSATVLSSHSPLRNPPPQLGKPNNDTAAHLCLSPQCSRTIPFISRLGNRFLPRYTMLLFFTGRGPKTNDSKTSSCIGLGFLLFLWFCISGRLKNTFGRSTTGRFSKNRGENTRNNAALTGGPCLRQIARDGTRS